MRTVWFCLLGLLALVGLLVPRLSCKSNQPITATDPALEQIRSEEEVFRPWLLVDDETEALKKTAEETLAYLGSARLAAFNRVSKAETDLSHWASTKHAKSAETIANDPEGGTLLSALICSLEVEEELRMRTDAARGAGEELLQLRRAIRRHLVDRATGDEAVALTKERLDRVTVSLAEHNPERTKAAKAQAETRADLMVNRILRSSSATGAR